MKIYTLTITDTDQTSGIYDVFTFANRGAALRKMRTLFIEEGMSYGYKESDLKKCADGTYLFPESGDWDEPRFDNNKVHPWAAMQTWNIDLVETDLDEEVVTLTQIEKVRESDDSDLFYKVISAWRAWTNAEAEEWICDTENKEDFKLLCEEYDYNPKCINPNRRYCFCGTNFSKPMYITTEELKNHALFAIGELDDNNVSILND